MISHEESVSIYRKEGPAALYRAMFPHWKGAVDILPSNSQESLVLWIAYGIQPGSFLTSVLQNDLMGALGRADKKSRANLFLICEFLWNYAPSLCFGTPSKVAAWRGCIPAADEVQPLSDDLDKIGDEA